MSFILSIFSDQNSFINSNGFQTTILAFVTSLAAFAAYWVYQKEQRQQDQDAAAIVYLQLKEAEICISALQKNGFAINQLLNPIIKKDHWGDNKHRLIKYLHADDLNCIDNFLNRASVAEGVRREARSIVMAGYEEKARIYQKIAGELAVEYSSKKMIQRDFESFLKEKNKKLKYLSEDSTPFLPRDFFDTAISELGHITLITQSSAGEKLRLLSEGKIKPL
ncbi:hypothetical protein [Photobacterium leiognathi]|uniref:hypothetical protein n=1 Tax=Photobacterium leiognathi TaxID=553611 RepID=UPI0029815863|nr:hypothetical protein [Photobacterium leiognathi]